MTMKKKIMIFALLLSTLIIGCQNNIEDIDVESEYPYEGEYSDRTENYNGESSVYPSEGGIIDNTDGEAFDVIKVLEFETGDGSQSWIEVSRSDQQRTRIDVFCANQDIEFPTLSWISRNGTAYPPQNLHVSQINEDIVIYFRNSIFTFPFEESPYFFDHKLIFDGYCSSEHFRATPLTSRFSTMNLETENQSSIITSRVFSREEGGSINGEKIEIYHIETGITETFYIRDKEVPWHYNPNLYLRDINGDGFDDLLLLNQRPMSREWFDFIYLMFIWDSGLEEFVEVEFVNFDVLISGFGDLIYEDGYTHVYNFGGETGEFGGLRSQTFRWEGNRLIFVSEELLPDDYWD